MIDLVLRFETEKDREHFLSGWFLDGGGEYQHNESRDGHDMEHVRVGETIRDGTQPPGRPTGFTVE